jgi:tetratricopeptide (TPR) repeat protein
LNRLAFSTATLGGDFVTAVSYLDQARVLAEEINDDFGLAEYHMNACLVASLQGNFEDAVRHDGATARIGEMAGNVTLRIVGLLRRATNLLSAGRYDEAQIQYEDARELAKELGNEEAIAVLECMSHAPLRLRDGDVSEAIDILRHNLPTVDRYASFYAAASHLWMGQCAVLVGDWETALAEFSAAERIGRNLSQVFGLCAGLAGRAMVLATCGLPDAAADPWEQAEKLVQTPEAEFYSTSSWAYLARASLQLGDLDTSGAAFQAALDASSVTSRWERARNHLGLVRIALARGDSALAAGHLEEARRTITTDALQVHEAELFLLDGALAAAEERVADAVTLLTQAERSAAESGLRPLRVEALDRLAVVRTMQGDSAAAESADDRAGSLIAEMASTIVDEKLRSSFREAMSVRTLGAARRPDGTT